MDKLSFAASNITSLSRENKDYVSGMLVMLDTNGNDYWTNIDCKTLGKLTQLSLSMQTSMPNLLSQITDNHNFLDKAMLQANEIDDVANCVVSMIKMA